MRNCSCKYTGPALCPLHGSGWLAGEEGKVVRHQHGRPKQEVDAYPVAAAIYRRIRREDGYQPFGWDWPTLFATRPRTAWVYYQALVALRQVRRSA